MKMNSIVVAGTAAAVLALPAFAAGDKERTSQREMDRGVPGVDVNIGRNASDRGVPGIEINTDRQRDTNVNRQRDKDRGVPGVDVNVGRNASDRGVPGVEMNADRQRDAKRGVPGVDVDVNRRSAAQGSMHHAKVREAQQALQRAGFDPGPIDGMMGPKTAEALREFQNSKNVQVTGKLNEETLSALNIDASASIGAGRDSEKR